MEEDSPSLRRQNSEKRRQKQKGESDIFEIRQASDEGESKITYDTQQSTITKKKRKNKK